MALTIRVEGESGRIDAVIRDGPDSLLDLIGRVDRTELRLLGYLSAESRMVFNWLQIDELVADLRLLQARAQNAVERNLLAQVAKLAKKVGQGVHLYLRILPERRANGERAN